MTSQRLPSAPLMLMIGLPGSGKTTWAQRFMARRPGVRLISTDQVRAHLYGDEAIQGEWLDIWAQILQRLQAARAEIAEGLVKAVLYDATNARRRYRREVVQAARNCGYGPIVAVWLDTPLDLCLRRNQDRVRQVPAEVIEAMQRQLSAAPPSPEEGLDRIWRIQSG